MLQDFALSVTLRNFHHIRDLDMTAKNERKKHRESIIWIFDIGRLATKKVDSTNEQSYNCWYIHSKK